MLWLVGYDIVVDTVRRDIAIRLEAWGQRVQYSVFECELTLEQKTELENDIEARIDHTQDSVLWVPLCRHDRNKIQRIGATSELEQVCSSFLV